MNYFLINFFSCLLYAVVIWGVIGPSFKMSSRQKRNLYIPIIFVQLLIFYTYTYLFSDLVIYAWTFYDMKNMSLSKALTVFLPAGNVEPLYRLFMYFIASITDNFRVFLAINASIILYCYFKTIGKFSPYFPISFFLFLLIVFQSSIYILRQHLSLAIILLSFTSIINRELKKFLLICLVAFLLHSSALFFIPVYFLYNIKKKSNYIIIALLASLVFLGSMVTILALFVDQIERYSKFMDETSRFYSVMNWTYVFIFGAVLFSYVLICKRKVFDFGINKLMLSLLVIGFVASISCVGSPVPTRTFLCFYISAIWVIPITLKEIKDKLFKYLYFLFTFFLYFYIAFVSEIGIMEEFHFELELNI